MAPRRMIAPRTTETVVVDTSAGTNQVIGSTSGEKWLVLYAVIVTGTTAATLRVQSGGTNITGTMPVVANATIVYQGSENMPVWQAINSGDDLDMVTTGGDIDGWLVVQVQRA